MHVGVHIPCFLQDWSETCMIVPPCEAASRPPVFTCQSFTLPDRRDARDGLSSKGRHMPVGAHATRFCRLARRPVGTRFFEQSFFSFPLAPNGRVLFNNLSY